MTQLVPISSKLRQANGSVFFQCPGCGTFHGVRVAPPETHLWIWNLDPVRPTFSPSLLVTQRTWTPPVTSENLAEWQRAPWPQTKVEHVCHSFITDGRIEFLHDCTHALAGQTVDIPDWSAA